MSSSLLKHFKANHGLRNAALWGLLACGLSLPVALSLTSPLLEWRSPIYIGAGLTGIAALCILLLQPLLGGQMLPSLTRGKSLRLHRAFGIVLLGSVILHILGLWITSPPDVIDALTFSSPTRFSLWGVIAMWGVFITAALAVRHRKTPPKTRQGRRFWQMSHTALAAVIAISTALHAWLIDGTMEPISKTLLCVSVVLATAWITFRHWRKT